MELLNTVITNAVILQELAIDLFNAATQDIQTLIAVVSVTVMWWKL